MNKLYIGMFCFLSAYASDQSLVLAGQTIKGQLDQLQNAVAQLEHQNTQLQESNRQLAKDNQQMWRVLQALADQKADKTQKVDVPK